MAIDALTLLGENRFGPSLEPERALQLAGEEDVSHLVAAPARPAGYRLEPANERLAEDRDRLGRLTLLGRIDPLEGDAAVTEAERCLADLGARGLFLHPAEEAFTIHVARSVFEVAADRGVPVVVATGYFALSEPLQIAAVARDFPSVTTVLTSGGQINISGLSMIDAWAALTRTESLHVLTNGEYRQDFIERLASEFDPARVMWASFAPVFDFRFERARIRSAKLGDDARKRIETGNAAALFGIST
ncbi:MAG: amidohydrolase family protein [Nitriliruptorales bacterium]